MSGSYYLQNRLMKRDVLFENLEVVFDRPRALCAYDSRGFLYTKCSGYLSREQWEKDTKDFVEASINRKTNKIVADYTELQGTLFPTIKLLLEQTACITAELNEIKAAFIFSKNEVLNVSINKFLEKLGELSDKVDFQIFTNQSEAVKWLTNETSHIEGSNDLGLITIRFDGKYQVIDVNDVYFIFRENDIIYLTLKEKTYTTRGTIQDFLLTLPDFFVQIHRAFIINIKKIETLSYYAGGNYIVYLKDFPDKKFSIGKKYAPSVKKTLGIKRSW